uniref:GTPase IMAP family member 7-like n=2 Tax=Pundamilia nyererei TaxID=303518 RepID=A0A3B4H7E7_9CICH
MGSSHTPVLCWLLGWRGWEEELATKTIPPLIKYFVSSSVTAECSKQQEKLVQRMVSVVDTPGLFDTSLSEDVVKREISKCINMSAPGPHAILLIIRVGPFSAEERDAVKKMEEIFGDGAWRYTVILFTHGDKVGADFDEMLKTAGAELQEVLKKAGNRYHIFNNHRTDDRGQVLDLLEKVDKMVANNGGEFYSNFIYLQVEEMLKQRESELSEFYEKKLKEEIKAVELKYEKKLKEAQEEKQQVEERLQSELEEVKRYYWALESGVREIVEQVAKDDSFSEILTEFHKTLKLN